MEASIQTPQIQTQQVQAQQAQAQSPKAQKVTGYRTATGTDGMTQVKDGQLEQGAFGKLLNKMLGQETGEDTMLEEAGELLRAFEEEMEGGDTDAAMQLLAQLFAAQPGLVQQVDPALLAQLTGQSPDTAVQVVNSLPQFAMAALLGQQNVPADVTAQQPQQDGQAFLNELVKQTGMEVVQATTGGAAGKADGQNAAMLGEAGYQRALYQAQQQLEGGTGKAPNVLLEEPGAVGAKDGKQTPQMPAAIPFPTQFTNAADATQLVQQTNPEEDLQALLAQVKTGLLEGAQKGDKDFVIKLKPEGLGEITVRMIQQGGKITMDILANNQNTQRLLAGELTNLRQAMEPYNVVVNPQQADGGSTAFNLEQQMRQGFAQQEQHGRQENSRYIPQDDTPDEASANGWEQQTASGLDAYI